MGKNRLKHSGEHNGARSGRGRRAMKRRAREKQYKLNCLLSKHAHALDGSAYPAPINQGDDDAEE
jgi:hypothetical protein